jgi:hypothetical protein
VTKPLCGKDFVVSVGYEQGVPGRIGRKLDIRLVGADEQL